MLMVEAGCGSDRNSDSVDKGSPESCHASKIGNEEEEG